MHYGHNEEMFKARIDTGLYGIACSGNDSDVGVVISSDSQKYARIIATARSMTAQRYRYRHTCSSTLWRYNHRKIIPVLLWHFNILGFILMVVF